MLTVALKLCKIFEIYGRKVESTRNSNFGNYLGEIWRLGGCFPKSGGPGVSQIIRES